MPGILGRAIGLTGGMVMGHSFFITLLETHGSTWDLVKSVGGAAALDLAIGGFAECTGLEMTLQLEAYKEGGCNGTTLQFPSRTEWSQIVLKKGVGAGQSLWDWSYEYVEGKGKRRDGLIILANDMRVPNNIWYFRNGLPVKYSGPTLNAKESAVAIESMTIAHEGLYQVPFVGYGAAAASAVAGKVL
jgi:phage tail-like protein